MEKERKIILLVDDSIINLRIGKAVLEKEYTVITTPSAEKMFYFLEKIKPDIILLDIDMPEMNGFEAIKILKSKPETKQIPVIFLISCIEVYSEFLWLFLDLGAVDYITKPFNPYILIKRVENLLENTFITHKISHNQAPAQAGISINRGNNEI